MSVHGDYARDENTIWVELGGLLYTMTLVEFPPVGDDGRTYEMLIDHDERCILCWRGLPASERSARIAAEAGIDSPDGITWRLVPVDETRWRHVPMATLTD